jgi:DNA-directed RNA polymerase subunit E"
MPEKACKTCRRLVKGNLCPICKTSELTSNWRGVIVIVDPNSEIAKEAGITASGKYATKVK